MTTRFLFFELRNFEFFSENFFIEDWFKVKSLLLTVFFAKAKTKTKNNENILSVTKASPFIS